MTEAIIGLVCLVLAFLVSILRRAYFDLPIYELRRRAMLSDDYAAVIFPVASYGFVLRAFLWLIMAALTSLGFVLISRSWPIWLSIIVVIISLWLGYSWLANKKLSSFSRKLVIMLTPLVKAVISLIYPVLVKLEKLERLYSPYHSQLYEAEDMLRLLYIQSSQGDNRFSPKQLIRLKRILEFDQAIVGDYITDKDKLHIVYAEDLITPVFLDELHKLKQPSFMVYKSKNVKKIVGILHWQDLGLNTNGKVADYMRLNVEFVNQTELVENALAKFVLSGQSVLVVNDNNKRFVGILTIKDALSALLSLKDPDKNINLALIGDDQANLVYNDLVKTGETVDESID